MHIGYLGSWFWGTTAELMLAALKSGCEDVCFVKVNRGSLELVLQSPDMAPFVWRTRDDMQHTPDNSGDTTTAQTLIAVLTLSVY